MADIAVLGIKVDTSQVNGASKDLDGLTAAGRRAEKSTDNLSSSFGSLRGIIATVGIGATVNQFVQLADTYSIIQARLKIAVGETGNLVEVQKRLVDISNRQLAPLAETVSLYTNSAAAAKELGASQGDLLRFTEGVNAALRINGTTAQAASGALLQLGQAIGGNIIQAQEYNSLIDGARPLLQAVANNLDRAGGSVNKLTKLVKEGEVTSREFFEAAVKGSEELIKKANGIETIGGSFQILKNQTILAVGEFDKAAGVSKNLSESLVFLGENIKTVSLSIAALVGGRLTQFLTLSATEFIKSAAAARANALANVEVAKAEAATTAATVAATTARVAELRTVIASTEGYVQLAIATNGLIPAQARAAAAAEANALAMARLATAQKAASISTAASNTALGIAGRAIGFLGGPIGAIVTLLGLAATAWVAFGDSAEEAASKNVSAADRALEKIKALREQSLVTRSGGNPLAVELQEAGNRYAAAIANVRMQPNIHGVLVQTGTEQMQKAKVELERVTKLYQEAEQLINRPSITAASVSQASDKKSKVATRFKEESRYAQDLAQDMAELIQRFEEAARPTENMSQELERQLSAYGRIDPAVKAYLQSLLDMVRAEELAQLQADSLADSQEHLNQTLEKDEGLQEWARLKEEAASLYAETRTPLEQFEAKILEIQKLLENGLINPDTAGRASANAYADFVKQNETTTDEITEFWKEAARNMQDAMSDFFFSAMEGDLSDLAGNFTKTINRMVADLAAAQFSRYLFGESFGKNGEIGGVAGSLFSGAGDFFGDLFGGFFADGGYLPPGKWGIAGEKGPEPIFGGKTGVTVQSNSGTQPTVINLTQNISTQDAGSFMRSSRQVAQNAKRQLDIAMRVS